MRIKFRVPGLDAAPRYIWVGDTPHELRVRTSFARADVLLHFHYIAPNGTTIDHDSRDRDLHHPLRGG